MQFCLLQSKSYLSVCLSIVTFIYHSVVLQSFICWGCRGIWSEWKESFMRMVWVKMISLYREPISPSLPSTCQDSTPHSQVCVCVCACLLLKSSNTRFLYSVISIQCFTQCVLMSGLCLKQEPREGVFVCLCVCIHSEFICHLINGSTQQLIIFSLIIMRSCFKFVSGFILSLY